MITTPAPATYAAAITTIIITTVCTPLLAVMITIPARMTYAAAITTIIITTVRILR
jgi:hypothetical protein